MVKSTYVLAILSTMTSTQPNSQFAQIAQRVRPGSALLRAWALPGGISAQMTALEVRDPDGQIAYMVVREPDPRVLQRNPAAIAREYQTLDLVQSVGVAAPQPYLLDESGTILPFPYLVMEYIDGVPDYAPADIEHYVRQFATQLAAIHRIDGTQSALAFLPRQADSLAIKLENPPAVLDASLQEARIRAALARVWPLPPTNRLVLVHGDFWPGNLLWRNGQLIAVVDWEDAAVGNPLADFAISRLDLLWIFGVEAMRAFTAHYQHLVDLDFRHLAYWDLAAALRPMGRLDEWAADWTALGRPDITESSMRAGHEWFIEQAFAALGAI